MQHVVSQLVTKKEELQGELKYCKQRIKDLEELYYVAQAEDDEDISESTSN
ncbi:MAG: hypothetical protein IE909_16805 [Campylobacterales bacterium]|nr:hypothetical protein [Campylobacterales bacterium]